MKLVNEKSFLDRKCFRCYKKFPKLGIKYSIHKNNFLEDIRINIIIFRMVKNVHAYWVWDNRNKETLLPNIAKFVYTVDDIKVNKLLWI